MHFVVKFIFFSLADVLIASLIRLTHLTRCVFWGEKVGHTVENLDAFVNESIRIVPSVLRLVVIHAD